MKKCSFCGHENADTAANCTECDTELGGPGEAPPEDAPLETFNIPPLSPAEKHKDLVTLLTCRTLIEADLIASRLRGVGIETFLPDQQLMQTIGWNLNTYGYVRVQISPADYDNARALLNGPDKDT